MQHLGELVLSFLNRKLQPSCQLACLETVRILSRDKHCLDPFITRSAMSTLACYAGIAVAGTPTPAYSQSVEGQGNSCQLSQVFSRFYHSRKFLSWCSCFVVSIMKIPWISRITFKLHYLKSCFLSSAWDIQQTFFTVNILTCLCRKSVVLCFKSIFFSIINLEATVTLCWALSAARTRWPTLSTVSEPIQSRHRRMTEPAADMLTCYFH